MVSCQRFQVMEVWWCFCDGSTVYDCFSFTQQGVTPFIVQNVHFQCGVQNLAHRTDHPSPGPTMMGAYWRAETPLDAFLLQSFVDPIHVPFFLWLFNCWSKFGSITRIVIFFLALFWQRTFWSHLNMHSCQREMLLPDAQLVLLDK